VPGHAVVGEQGVQERTPACTPEWPLC
jgi:hypothetical protein